MHINGVGAFAHIVLFALFYNIFTLYLANFYKNLHFTLICDKIFGNCVKRRAFFTKRFTIFVLAFLLAFGSFTVFANDTASEGRTLSEQRALEKIYELASVLDGKYFTTTQKTCGNNACNRCKNLNVTSCEWFVDTFGYSVTKKQMPKQYFSASSLHSPEGWSCFGFSVFAHWYIFSPSNDGIIGSDVSLVASYSKNKTIKFNQETLATYARPGDAIRIVHSDGGHSVIYVSCDEKGVTVLDNNYLGKNLVGLHKIPYSANYYGRSISSCGISITRANNYDTVEGGTTCAVLTTESEIDFLDINSPITHTQGCSFSLGGRIVSGKLIDTISVRILDAKTEKTVFEYTVAVGRRTYSIAGSDIDSKTKFGSLKKGVYFLEYTAADSSGYTETYRSDCFSVCDGSHDCNFSNGEYDGNKLTYTCGICGRFEIYELPKADEEPSLPPITAPDETFPPVITNLPGDVDGNGKTDASDAIYLLYSHFFGAEKYPINLDCDFDINNLVNANDAIYLLYHVFFGAETYPISK